MKKFLLAGSIFVLSILLGLGAIAQPTDKDKGTINVNASTTKEISPNQAEITISIETFDVSIKKASENNKIIANKVYASLKSILGFNDYLKTGNYSAEPQYIYTKDNKKVFDKYIVTNTITVKTKNIKLIPKLIDTSIAQGATKIDDLIFSTTDYDDICNTTLAELTKKAYSKANTVANAINAKIIGIQSINTSCNTNRTPYPIYAYPMLGKASMSHDSATPISSGSIKLFANIDASFYVD